MTEPAAPPRVVQRPHPALAEDRGEHLPIDEPPAPPAPQHAVAGMMALGWAVRTTTEILMRHLVPVVILAPLTWPIYHLVARAAFDLPELTAVQYGLLMFLARTWLGGSRGDGGAA